MAKRGAQFQTIRTEGAILPPDILRCIASLKVDGASPDAYHLPPGSKLNEAISRSWTTLLSHWQAFQEARDQMPESDETGTALTNERWLLPLFKELDYGRLVTTKSPEIDERVYPIERFYNNTPIHLIGCRLELDKRKKGARGAATASPHSMVQEFLNRSDEHLWAFLSNGLQLRILRDNVSLSRQAFVEFDLESMMEGKVYPDFALLWLLCHQSRVESDKATDCWLEKWSNLAREQGTRVLNDLRVGVQKAIEALGRGFIGHPRNDRLREKLHAGTLSRDDFYRQLLRLVYRLLFLFVAEDRELLHPPPPEPTGGIGPNETPDLPLPLGEGRGEGPVGEGPLRAHQQACELYDTHYSTRRLRELSLKIRGSKHADLWHSLSLVFDALGRPDGCPALGLAGLGSFLWEPSSTPDLPGPHQAPPLPPGDGRKKQLASTKPPLPLGEGWGEGKTETEPVFITNDDLLLAIRELAYVEQDRTLRIVDYRNLGSEELGSVYESLLELHPVLNANAKSFDLLTAAGNERKTTGSYYTPDSLVQCLLDSALDPVVEDRLKGKKGDAAAQAILDLKVCDPACGSGHFLIAAAHRLARHLARSNTGETEPSPEDYQHALREVIGHCIYGVDINPMAVELCKVSLWIEAIEPGKPLSFLEQHIQCGNSLLGTTPALLADGIPDGAFKPIEGDVKAVAAGLKADNKKERREQAEQRGTQKIMFEHSSYIKLGNLPAAIARINLADDGSFEDVVSKQQMYERTVKGADYLNARLLADTWCAAFVWKKDDTDLGKLCPTEHDFRRIEDNPYSILPHVKEEVRRLAKLYQFFHWHLAFPDVFRIPEEGKAENEQTGWNAGFDVIVGNPPWEAADILEKEFFAATGTDIATAKTTDARKALINRLEEDDPALWDKWQQEKRKQKGVSQFWNESGVFPEGSIGKLNTYRLFAELAVRATSPNGMTGLILKSGIVTGVDGQTFIRGLLECGRVFLVVDFINTELIFQDVVANERFCLFTVGGVGHKGNAATYAFTLTNVNQLGDASRFYSLSPNELGTLNPNDLSVPPITSLKDKELVLYIHQSHSAAVIASKKWNPWHVRYCQGHLNSSTGSKEFSDYTFEEIEARGGTVQDDGTFLFEGETLVPYYEGKLLGSLNHRFGTFEGVPREKRFGVKAEANHPTLAQLANPCYGVRPRYWMPKRVAIGLYQKKKCSHDWVFAFRDVCRAVVDARTLQACVLPKVPCNHKSPFFAFDSDPTEASFAALVLSSAWASFVVDYALRQKIAGATLTKGISYQLPIPSPQGLKRPFGNADYHTFIHPRALELGYVSWTLESWATRCGYAGPPFRWDEDRRFLLRCELDAAYFHLYLGSPADWGTDSPQLREMFPTPRDAVDYIMETFPIVRRKDIARTEVKNDAGEIIQQGRYITKDTILEIYDAMQQAIDSGEPYQTRLDPPPGPPADAAGHFIPLADWDADNWPPHVHPPRKESEVAT